MVVAFELYCVDLDLWRLMQYPVWRDNLDRRTVKLLIPKLFQVLLRIVFPLKYETRILDSRGTFDRFKVRQAHRRGSRLMLINVGHPRGPKVLDLPLLPFG